MKNDLLIKQMRETIDALKKENAKLKSDMKNYKALKQTIQKLQEEKMQLSKQLMEMQSEAMLYNNEKSIDELNFNSKKSVDDLGRQMRSASLHSAEKAKNKVDEPNKFIKNLKIDSFGLGFIGYEHDYNKNSMNKSQEPSIKVEKSSTKFNKSDSKKKNSSLNNEKNSSKLDKEIQNLRRELEKKQKIIEVLSNSNKDSQKERKNNSIEKDKTLDITSLTHIINVNKPSLLSDKDTFTGKYNKRNSFYSEDGDENSIQNFRLSTNRLSVSSSKNKGELFEDGEKEKNIYSEIQNILEEKKNLIIKALATEKFSFDLLNNNKESHKKKKGTMIEVSQKSLKENKDNINKLLDIIKIRKKKMDNIKKILEEKVV